MGAVFERFGAVKAGPFTAARLLREREAVLLFPGGGREVRPHPASMQLPPVAWLQACDPCVQVYGRQISEA